MEKFIYLCGPTVYDKVHIGNMRPIVTFDIMLRAFKYKNSKIKFIHNITDIDDKIINKAMELQKKEQEISEQYYKFYLKMLKQYNVETIDYKPKVTKNIKLIEKFIEKLKSKNFVYESNNSYYFKIKKINSYGEVSNNSLNKLKNQHELIDKENSQDFSLWKNKIKGQAWETKFGLGRPGWHTECAAFIQKYTKGKPLLIHGGGIDLKFPHHENENAQFRALNKNPICKQWIHIGIINFNNQKMSKSTGNIMFADEFYNKYKNQTNSSDLFRLLILSTSISSSIELNDELLEPLIKKISQLEKVVNFVLLNQLKVNKKINNQAINDLMNQKFSNIYKYINQTLKSFNESKISSLAIELFNLLSFLGFKITNKKITKDDIKTYNLWIKLKNEKKFDKSDIARNKLMRKNLI